MKTTAILLLAAGILPLAACNSNPKGSGGAAHPLAPRADLPAWIASFPNVPGYPREKYLIGIGGAELGANVADAARHATEDAKAYIARQIETDLSAVTESYAKQVVVGDKAEYVAELEQSIRSSTAQMLSGAKAVESHADPQAGHYQVLVVLDIDQHVAATLSRIDSSLSSLGSEAASAGESAGARLKRLANEYSVLAEILPRLASLETIVRRESPSFPSVQVTRQAVLPRYGNARNGLSAMPFDLRVVSGNRQRGFAGEGLAEPIVFGASVGGEPLDAVPIEFLVEYPGQAEIVQASTTSAADGTFRCRLTGLQLTGDAENEVWGRLDYARLKLADLEPPVAKATYLLPTIEMATFAVVVLEESDGQPRPGSAIASRFERMLQGWGARLVPIDQVLPEVAPGTVADAESSWLKQKIAGQLDYVIVGRARALNQGQRPVAPGSDKLGTVAHAGGSLRLIDLRSGDELVSVNQPPNASFGYTGRDMAVAGDRALGMFADEVEPRVCKEIARIFGL